MDEKKEAKVVDIKDAEIKEVTADPVENHEETVVSEEKHTIFGKIDQKIVARRKAKAEKKASKKPMNKAQKAAIIGGGAAFGLGLLGLGFKAAVNAASKIPDDPPRLDDGTDDYGYPSEEEPAEVAVEEAETTETDE